MGETLSHASYPGLMFSVLILSQFPRLGSFTKGWWVDLVALIGAWASSGLGVLLHSRLVRAKVSSDAALCWVLSSFLGLGVLLGSKLQFSAPRLYHRAQVFLYGQAATLSDQHLWLFSLLVSLMILAVILFFRPLLLQSFDREYARCLGLRPLLFRVGIQLLLTAIIVAGLRAGGVLVMAALLVAPAVSARWWSQSFKQMLILSAGIGAFTGVLGNILSLEIEGLIRQLKLPLEHILPTGPAIVIVGCLIALVSVLIAPKRGLFSKWRKRRQLRSQWLAQLQAGGWVREETR
jgi:manganese/zinc/iron transport system permease protein